MSSELKLGENSYNQEKKTKKDSQLAKVYNLVIFNSRKKICPIHI
jgi:hypothetical protein